MSLNFLVLYVGSRKHPGYYRMCIKLQFNCLIVAQITGHSSFCDSQKEAMKMQCSFPTGNIMFMTPHVCAVSVLNVISYVCCWL